MSTQHDVANLEPGKPPGTTISISMSKWPMLLTMALPFIFLMASIVMIMKLMEIVSKCQSRCSLDKRSHLVAVPARL